MMKKITGRVEEIKRLPVRERIKKELELIVENYDKFTLVDTAYLSFCIIDFYEYIGRKEILGEEEFEVPPFYIGLKKLVEMAEGKQEEGEKNE